MSNCKICGKKQEIHFYCHKCGIWVCAEHLYMNVGEKTFNIDTLTIDGFCKDCIEKSDTKKAVRLDLIYEYKHIKKTDYVEVGSREYFINAIFHDETDPDEILRKLKELKVENDKKIDRFWRCRGIAQHEFAEMDYTHELGTDYIVMRMNELISEEERAEKTGKGDTIKLF